MRRLVVSLLLFTLLGAACLNRSNKVSYPESTDGLKTLMSDILEAQKSGNKDKFNALVKSLAVPDADKWFKKVFGDDKGVKVAAQYKSNTSQIEQDLARIFAKVVDDAGPATEGRQLLRASLQRFAIPDPYRRSCRRRHLAV